MFLKKTLAIIGILIPILFVISFGLLFSSNSVYYEVIDELPLFCFNILELQGSIWVRIFNYFFIGVLIIVFSFGLMVLNSKSFSNNLSLLLLASTGLIWCSFSFFSISIEDEDPLDYAYIVIFIFILFAFLAFLLLSGDILLMIKNRNVKRALVITSILILTESIISFFVSDYPFMIPNLSILFYISVFPILGYNLIKEDN
ncbi:MAG: hypothetical protein CMO82_08965 [Winogradskyella sp.]|nr:hypothetical protein [Winogradskyella sp.]|tara:strand:- start:680 stop:1282 length:603 start_codon:yes stop_codon:yes gene_type:complete